MKKNYYSLFAAGTMLLAASSCSQEEAIPQPSRELVSFEISLEGVAESRIAGDGLTANKLYYEVYQGKDTDRKKVLDNYGDGKTVDHDVITLDGGKTEVKLPLLRGENYEIMFWAQADNSIYNPNDLEKISVTYDENTTANNEAYDAFFYGDDEFKATNDVTKIELRRPFAQLNIGTHEKDWAQALEVIGGTDAPVTQSTVTVTNLATSFNVLSGVATAPEEPNTVTFKLADINGETFEAKDADYNNLAMNYLLVPGTPDEEGNVKSTTNVTATFYRGTTNLFTIGELPTVAIQRNWRTNILGNLLADDKTFTIEVVPGFNDVVHNIDYSTVDNDKDLEAALRQTDDEIVIDLAEGGRAGKTYTVNIGAWTEKYYFGGANTKTITINANDNTICFNHNDGDWNYIRCVNENAKWIINNAHLTNSGKNDGPWNRHDIRFYNAVELNDVTSDKAIALLNNGKLENVSITEDIEAYGLWITAQGQTVDINNLEITATNAGRGIKIADEYVDEPKSVTLNVANSKFTTAKKAAILVTSTAGATIKLENIDLSGVAADGFNAVWVDEKRADYADLVTVTGGFKKVESAEETAETNPFLKENATVQLPAGSFVVPTNIAKGVTIEGATDGTTILDMTGKTYSGKEGLTFKNLTVKLDNQIYVGIQQSKDLVYENCVINGTIMLYANAIFNNCTFNVEGDAYNVWTYGSTNAKFENCTFNCDGKSVLVYNEGHNGSEITMNKCKFIANSSFEGKAAVEIDSSLLKEGQEYIVNLNECTATGFEEGTVSKNTLFNPKKGTKADIYIDGKKIVINTEDLTEAIASSENIITLGYGIYDGIYYHNVSAKTFKSLDAENKAIITGKFVANADVTFENIDFKPSENSLTTLNINTYGKKVNGQYAAIVTVNKVAATFEGCTFTELHETHAANAITYFSEATDKVLKVNNCTFGGKSQAIYSKILCEITNSKFNLNGGVATNVWPRVNGKGSVVFTGNENEAENSMIAIGCLTQNGSYKDVEFNIQNNTGNIKSYVAVSSARFATDGTVTFAEGSETFNIREDGKMQ